MKDLVSAAFSKLEPASIRTAEGFLKYDYLTPAGYYQQMWDWDGFFIGCHLAHQSREKAKYLKWWVLNFAGAVDQEGYVAGCLYNRRSPPTVREVRDEAVPGAGGADCVGTSR